MKDNVFSFDTSIFALVTYSLDREKIIEQFQAFN